MLILFGWNRTWGCTLRSIFSQNCRKCGNKAVFDWRHPLRITWITLFFIPVIPYSIEYLISCTACGGTFAVNADSRKKVRELIKKARQRRKEEYYSA